MRDPSVVLSVRIPPELRERIARLATNRAAKLGRAKPITREVTIEALTSGLEVLEAIGRKPRSKRHG